MARATRGSSRGSRLRKSWSAIGVINDVTISATQLVLGSVTLVEGAGQDATVLRCRGNLLITATPDAATDSDVIAFGIGVVTVNALTVGGTSVPGPLESMGWDGWLWHQFVPMDAFGASGVATNMAGKAIATSHRVEIDAKAMRRLPQDNAVILVAELSIGDFASVEVSGGMRVLIGT